MSEEVGRSGPRGALRPTLAGVGTVLLLVLGATGISAIGGLSSADEGRLAWLGEPGPVSRGVLLLLVAVLVAAVVALGLRARRTFQPPPARSAKGTWAARILLAALVLLIAAQEPFRDVLEHARQAGERSRPDPATPDSPSLQGGVDPTWSWPVAALLGLALVLLALVLVRARSAGPGPGGGEAFPAAPDEPEHPSASPHRRVAPHAVRPDGVRPRDRVIGAYRAMEDVLAEAGVAPRPGDTPSALLRRAERVLPGPAPAAELTALYRAARYSAHDPTTEDAERADAGLDAVRRQLLGEATPAGAP